jgi:hypothetical protein
MTLLSGVSRLLIFVHTSESQLARQHAERLSRSGCEANGRSYASQLPMLDLPLKSFFS